MFSGGPGDAKGQAERLLEPAGGQAPGDAALGVPLGPAELKILLFAPKRWSRARQSQRLSDGCEDTPEAKSRALIFR